MYETTYDQEERIWRGKKTPYLFDPDLSLGYLIITMLERTPSKIAQICDNTGSSLTCNDLRLRSIRIAQNLAKLGRTQQSDVIGIVCNNSENLAAIAYAAFLGGNPISSLDPRFESDEIIHVFGITEPKLVFCDAENYNVMQKSLDALGSNAPIYVVSGEIPGAPSITDLLRETGTENQYMPPILKKGGKEIAVILCSSGTTGLPKGVALSHACVINNFFNFFRSNSEDVLFNFSTIYWITGFIYLIFSPLSGATKVITNKRFSAELFLDIVERHKVTQVILPPSSVLAILNCPSLKTRDLSSIKLLVCGGSFCPPSLAESMSKYLPNGKFCIAYGSTEIGRTCSMVYSESRHDSVGKLKVNVEMKVVDEDGNNLGIGEPGELIVRSKYIFSGYYNNPEATNEVLEDGWLRLGDICYFDKDGYLHVVDRKKSVFKHRGYTVYPAQIESVISKIPGVLYVCVSSVSDGFMTDLPAAAVVKDPSSNLTEEDIVKFVEDKMLEYNHLVAGAYFVDAIPMTPSGKYRQREVRSLLSTLYKKKIKTRS